MFKKIVTALEDIRKVLFAIGEELEGLSKTLRGISEGSTEGERVTALEGAVESLNGRVEAGIVQQEALKAAARAAEDRGRGHLQRAEKALELAKTLDGGEDLDPFEAAGREYQRQLSPGDEDEGGDVQAVQNGVVGSGGRASVARAAKRR